MVPVDEARLKPAGSVPDVIAQPYGAVPPDVCSVCEYGLPTVAGVTAETAILRGGTATAMVTVDDLLWLGLLESARAKLMEKFPLAVGVPERMPVEGARETPEGS
jgi:hypothetical protein